MKKGDYCSFCWSKKDEVEFLIEGKGAFICNNCATEANKIVSAEMEKKGLSNISDNVEKPSVIKKILDEYIIGQDEAKKVISVAVYNHYKRLKAGADLNKKVEVDKSNIMMIGETGTGKTLIASTIAKVLKVPFCIADATVVTEAGYVGEDVETILTRLFQAANGDVGMTEKGIVYIDEIDKISRKGDNPSITKDVSGEGVQQALLKLLEGSTVYIPPQGGRKHPEQQLVPINTKNILFICGGAFDGLEKIIEKRISNQNIGFKKQVEAHEEDPDKINYFSYVTPQDLKRFGLIPELIGRLPVLTHLDRLNKDVMKLILTQPKNAIIKQYEYLLGMENVKLKFEEEAIDAIAQYALDLKVGARGLRSLMENVMMDVMFESPDQRDEPSELVVDAAFIKDKLKKYQKGELRVA